MKQAQLSDALAEVEFAYARVPMYRKRLADGEEDLQQLLKSERFDSIPTTCKADYRRNFPVGAVVDGVNLSASKIQLSRSSGTTGDRLVTALDRHLASDRFMHTLNVHPAFWSMLASGVRASCLYGPPNCSEVECANPRVTKDQRRSEAGMLVLPVAHDLLATPEDMQAQAVQEINDEGAHSLIVEPSHGVFLARAWRRYLGDRRPNVVFGMTSYGLTTPLAQARLAAFWGVGTPHANIFSCSEFGFMGATCVKGSMHLNTRDFYLEVVDEEGHEVPVGEEGMLCVTSIGDRISPHIRYLTGDSVRRVPEPCPCGQTSPVFLIEGRRTSYLYATDGSVVSPRRLHAMIGTPDFADLVQVRQLAREQYQVEYLPAEWASVEAKSSEVQLLEVLASLLGEGAKLSIRQTNYLQSERSGKFASTKCELKELS